MLKRENHIEIDRRKFYKTVLALVVPMALQNLINVGVTAADVIMLGAVGEKALSGASLAGQIQYIMTLFLFGLTSGATVLTAQYWGKGDRDAIEKILGMAVKAAVCVTALFTVSALAVPELLMQVFTNDPVVVSEGVKYLRIVAFTYIMMGVTQAYLYIMRSVERVVVATVVYLLSLICNIIMNAIFIFGLLGLPKMGVAGAALGTLCARILEVVLVAIYARLFNREIRLRFKYVLHTDKILFSDFMRYALPVVVNEVLWGLGTAANTAILGHMGSAAVAANSVAQVARQLATVVSFWVVQRGGDLSWKDDRREKDRVCESICKTVSYIEHYHGNIGRNCDSCGFAFGIGGTDFERYGKRIFEDHVFCYVLFCCRPGD